jgi:hypothetical protein
MAVLEALSRGPVTVTGMGGIGKSELARAVAARWPGASLVVPLESADSVLAAVATTLGVPANPEVVRAALDRDALWVFDGAEAHRAELAALLRRPPRACLVTSRLPVGLRGERAHALGPLDDDAAAALFEARAGRTDPDLVAALQGVPLVLELAAATTRILTPAELLRRRTRWLDLLADDAGSLRGHLDATWSLLDTAVQQGWCRLACLRSRPTLDLVEAVLADLSDEPTTLLRRLAEAAIVHRRDDRWVLLELVRDYGLQRATRADVDVVARAVLHHASRQADAIWGPDPVPALAALEALEPDLDALSRHPVHATDALLALQPVWYRRGLLTVPDPVRRLDAAHPTLALTAMRLDTRMVLGLLDDPEPLAAEAEALRDAAQAAGDADLEALAALRQLEIAGARGGAEAAEARADALFSLAQRATPAIRARVHAAAAVRGHADARETRLRQAVRIARRHGVARALARAQALLTMQLDDDGRLDELARTVPDLELLAQVATHSDAARLELRLAVRAHQRHDSEDALAVLEALLDDPRIAGTVYVLAAATVASAHVLLDLGRRDDAHPLVVAQLGRLQDLGGTTAETIVRAALVYLCLDADDLLGARREAEAMRESATTPRVRRALRPLHALVDALAGRPTELPPATVCRAANHWDLAEAGTLAAVLAGDGAAHVDALRASAPFCTPRLLADVEAFEARLHGRSAAEAPRSLFGRLALR